MARPRIYNLKIRFPDASDFWDMALGNNGTAKAFADEKAAIHFQHQLNMFRKASRDNSGEGLTVLDNYIVRRENHRVFVMPRPRIDLSDATTLDGQPINADFYIKQRDPFGNPIASSNDHNPAASDKPLKLTDN